MPSFSQIFFSMLSFTLLIELFYRHYFKEKEIEKKELNEVIMFSADKFGMKHSKFKRQAISPSLDKLITHLYSSHYTLDICMYVFTNNEIAKVIANLQKTGVQIRLLIDYEMAYATGSHVKKLSKLGVIVRTTKSTNLMHHKFCLIDCSTELLPLGPVSDTNSLLLAGSLNWTSQAINGNWEDVIVTSQPDLVQAYKDEFERLWELFKPCGC